MESLWSDAIGFAYCILQGFSYQVDSQREAAWSAYWIIYYLIQCQGMQKHFYRLNSEDEEAGDVVEVIHTYVEHMEMISLTPFQHLADKMPVPLIVQRRWSDGRILDVELTSPMYAGLCALVAMFEGHLDNREALKCFLRERGVEKVLSTVMVFGHGLEAVCSSAADPDPSVILPKALKLVQAALNVHNLPHDKENEQEEEEEEEEKSPLNERVVALLMQIVTDVHLQYNLWDYRQDAIQTIPAVRNAALRLLHACVPEAMWKIMLRGSASTAATSFVLWLIDYINSEESATAETEALLLAHACTSAQVHLEVGSDMYRTFQAGASKSSGHQTLFNVLLDNPAWEWTGRKKCVDA